ncbi:hypothetical protein AB0300_14915 [Microbacterium sp. NPDC078814]|uniref:hypothetical protein n=1 Tax=Microbacterium sp. NPDC078814 TaxID=3154767 RepID=UPI00344E004F
MTENPNYISRAHPVRVILDNAAHGRQPSSNDLDQLLTDVSNERLPSGHSLDAFRADIIREARRIAAINGTGAHANATVEAEAAAAKLAGRMSNEQRALNTSQTKSSDREVEDIVARVFDN